MILTSSIRVATLTVVRDCIKDAHFSYPSGANVDKSENNVQYNHTPCHLDQKAQHEAVKEKDEEFLKKIARRRTFT